MSDSDKEPMLIEISWDVPCVDVSARNHGRRSSCTEYLTVDELREKYGKTNLFEDDGVWDNTNPHPAATWRQATTLAEVFHIIHPGDVWVCQNCTVKVHEMVRGTVVLRHND